MFQPVVLWSCIDRGMITCQDLKSDFLVADPDSHRSVAHPILEHYFQVHPILTCHYRCLILRARSRPDWWNGAHVTAEETYFRVPIQGGMRKQRIQ